MESVANIVTIYRYAFPHDGGGDLNIFFPRLRGGGAGSRAIPNNDVVAAINDRFALQSNERIDMIPTMHATNVNPRIQGGTPCFAGTRVPVASLFDHLKQGISIDEFLLDFPSVKRAQVEAVLEQSKGHAERDAITALAR